MLRQMTGRARPRFGGCWRETLGIKGKRLYSLQKNVEVEAKFAYSTQDVERIAAVSQLLSVKQFTDHYYDCVTGFPLTTNDIWLRQRNEKWELKMPLLSVSQQLQTPTASSVSHYKEHDDPALIISILRSCGALSSQALPFQPPVQNGEDLRQALASHNVFQFCALTTTRTSYRYKDVLRIDLDVTTPSEYRVGELELMVGDDPDEIKKALSTIETLGQDLQLTLCPTMRGKVLQFIFQQRPEHWRCLEKSGLLRAKRISVDPLSQPSP